jgi:4-carboxymuconolactone decarboxylase
MRPRFHFICLFAAAVGLFGSPAALTQVASLPTVGPTMPSDIDPQSGFRLPLPKREDLDEVGKRHYDRVAAPGASIAGLQGPSGIGLYSPKAAEHARALNRYLRFEAGFTPRVREIAILTTAREMDSQFEWAAHEPEALKEGVEPRVIEVIKHRKPTAGLDEPDATVIELGRQIFRDHKVTPETFAKAKALFGPNKLVELVMLMGQLRRYGGAAHRRRHAAAPGTKAAAADAVAVITGHSASADAREPAGDPAIHRLRKTFLQKRWTRGSSPRVTRILHRPRLARSGDDLAEIFAPFRAVIERFDRIEEMQIHTLRQRLCIRARRKEVAVAEDILRVREHELEEQDRGARRGGQHRSLPNAPRRARAPASRSARRSCAAARLCRHRS